MAITIKKIAELAGVSTGTVDRVINNRGHVKPDVEARIRTIIEELHYTPNLSAKSLARKKNPPHIGFIFHLNGNIPYNMAAKAGIEQFVRENIDFGIKVTLRFPRDFDAEDQLQMIDELLSEGVNALGIIPINDPRIAAAIDALLIKNFPVICFVSDIATRFPHLFVGVDNQEVGRIAAGLFQLIMDNHPQKLAIITPNSTITANAERIIAIRNAFDQTNCRFKILPICDVPTDEIGIYNAVKTYFQRTTATCVFYATSLNGGGITALRELNLLPALKIITLDINHFIIDGLLHGAIAMSISQNPYGTGYNTAKIILNLLLNNPTINNSLKTIKCEIIIKENIKYYTSLFPSS